jgi:hypothetical protein
MVKTLIVSAPSQRKSRTAKSRPTREDIQLRAYEIYRERRSAPGNPLEDWVQAERELLQGQRKTGRNSKTP